MKDTNNAAASEVSGGGAGVGMAVNSLFAWFKEPDSVRDLPEGRDQLVALKVQQTLERWLRRRCLSKDEININAGMNQEQGERVYMDACLLLLKTLIYAARADGEIDRLEHGSLNVVYRSLCSRFEAAGLIDELLTRELKVQELAEEICFDEERLDIYFLSSLIVGSAHFLEQNYLEELAAALHIAPSLKRDLDSMAIAVLQGEKVSEI